MKPIEIILKNEKQKWYHTIALIFLLLNFAVFIFLLFYDAYRYAALGFMIALVLYILLRWNISTTNKSIPFLDEFVFFIPVVGWFGLHNYLMAILCLFMGLLFKLALQQLKFVFTSEKVMKINFPKKQFGWNLFSNVILKDHILTLDFKNNKLIQAEIENLHDISEIQFNEFAQLQLGQAGM